MHGTVALHNRISSKSGRTALWFIFEEFEVPSPKSISLPRSRLDLLRRTWRILNLCQVSDH